jgi:hypothetical protein
LTHACQKEFLGDKPKQGVFMAAKSKKTARKQTSGMRDLSTRKDPRGGAQKKEGLTGRGSTNLSSKRGPT